MKKILTFGLLAFLVSIPASAQASIFDDLFGAVKDLQKQVADLVTMKIDLPKTVKPVVMEENWKTFSDSKLGFEVKFSPDYGTTTLFSVIPQFKDADAFVRNSRAEFLSKIVKPSSTSIDLVVQDSVIFFKDTLDDQIYQNMSKLGSKISTSTKQVGSSTALYILHSAKTDPAKFGGGSTEKYVFENGSTTIMAEANYSSDVPAGQLKTVFDRMLSTFKFIPIELSVSTTTTGSTTAMTGSSTESVSGTSTAKQNATGTLQTAGTVLGR